MLKTLLVDDNRNALEGLRRHIAWENTGCACVATAANGRDALALVEELHPDILITDVKMPFMDGLELCREVHRRYPGTHLIVLSAHDEFDFAREALLCGVEDYILKPIDTERLRELETLLRGIAEATEQYIKEISSFLDSKIGETLAASLRQGDEEETDRRLCALAELNSADMRVVEHVCIQLLKLLNRTLSELNMTSYLESDGLPVQLIALREKRSPELARDYVRNTFRAAARAIYANKNINTESMVRRVKQFIQENYNDPNFSTAMLSTRFNISQSYLCHIYKCTENTSINNYMTLLRMERACALLTGTQLSIVDVSAKIGYLDPHYFAKVFRKLKGITPTEYRRLAILGKE